MSGRRWWSTWCSLSLTPLNSLSSHHRHRRRQTAARPSLRLRNKQLDVRLTVILLGDLMAPENWQDHRHYETHLAWNVNGLLLRVDDRAPVNSCEPQIFGSKLHAGLSEQSPDLYVKNLQLSQRGRTTLCVVKNFAVTEGRLRSLKITPMSSAFVRSS